MGGECHTFHTGQFGPKEEKTTLRTDRSGSSRLNPLTSNRRSNNSNSCWSTIVWQFIHNPPVPVSDRRLLLRGMFRFDPEGPEDGVRRGHHRNPDSQEEEGRSEEAAGAALHQLLPDHMMTARGSAGPPSTQAETKAGPGLAEASQGLPSRAEDAVLPPDEHTTTQVGRLFCLQSTFFYNHL